VQCPRCSQQAVITQVDHNPCMDTPYGSSRLLCTHCTLTRSWAGERLHVLLDDAPAVLTAEHGHWMQQGTNNYLRRGYDLPHGLDTRFGAPLWLSASCCGGQLLWANNLDHLDYLSDYVGATLRERPTPPEHTHLAWLLPSWIKHAKNRDEVLRTLQKLRATISN
jgi:hypothetical protein